jgi:hypothetical protein
VYHTPCGCAVFQVFGALLCIQSSPMWALPQGMCTQHRVGLLPCSWRCWCWCTPAAVCAQAALQQRGLRHCSCIHGAPSAAARPSKGVCLHLPVLLCTAVVSKPSGSWFQPGGMSDLPETADQRPQRVGLLWSVQATDCVCCCTICTLPVCASSLHTCSSIASKSRH